MLLVASVIKPQKIKSTMIPVPDNFCYSSFLGVTPTSICYFFCPSICPSICLSICRAAYVRNRTSSSSDHNFWYTYVKWYLQAFFSTFSKFLIRGVKGQKSVKSDKKFCLSHFLSQELCIIWLSFVVHLCKIIISPAVFFIFSKFWFFGLLRG